MAQILDGRALADRIRQKVKQIVATLPSQPGMAAILVGDDPASHLYVSLKEKACAEAGIYFEKFIFDARVSEADLMQKVEELNKRPEINGILVQLPLPTQNPDPIIAAIDPNKDIDGFHKVSLERLEAREPGLVSPVALGVMKLLDAALADTQRDQKRAVLVCSEFFARPLVALLKEQGIESEIVSPDATDLQAKTKQADVMIVAIGRPKFITGSQLKAGAIIIDVGTTKTLEGLMGDVDFEAASKVASAITPVPGGVGPTTVAMLMMNVVKAYHLSLKQ